MQNPSLPRRISRFALYALPVLILILFLLREKAPFGSSNTSFAVAPGKEITAIEFTEGTRKLRLEKKGDDWFVNGKYESRKNSILFILEILTRIKIKSPVAPDLFNAEITSRNVVPVKVRVYDRKRILKSFLVYKTGSNIYGNIMKMRPGSKPFIVFIPGNESEIGSAFNTNELFWQPFTIFTLLPSEIAEVRLENVADTSSSFTIKNEGRRFILYDSSKKLAGWDTSRVERYISYFTHIPFENWALDLAVSEKERIMNEKPLYILTVVRNDGKKTTLTMWERWIEENGKREEDTDRLWARTNERDQIFVIRYMDIDPVLKKRSYFFP